MKALLCGLVFSCIAWLGIGHAAEPALKLDLGNGVGLDLVLIRAGSFTQGSPASEAGRGNDESERSVTLSRDYYIGQSAVTRAQWERFIADTSFRTESETGTSGGYGWTGSALEQKKEFNWKAPGFQQTGEHPVCLLTYPDAQAFCAWLEKKVRRKVTLPTEAQWEYACRAGTSTPWHGTDANSTAWHKDNAGKGTRPVSSKPANPWGLFIAGNVSEWCLDWYAPYAAGAATDPLQENPNLSDRARRVLRGGSWNRGPNNTRSAARYRADPRSRNADTGFRIVCAVEAMAVAAPPAAPPIPDRPSVEVESSGGKADPPSTPPSSHSTPPVRVSQPGSGVSFFGAIIKGLVCLLIPVGVIFLIIWQTVKGANRKRSSDSFIPRPPTSPPLPPGPPRMQAPVRKAEDGFWIDGDWPEGTPLTLRYVVAGVAMVQEVLYRPGNEGQFIYTGQEPDSISVVAGSEPMDTVERGLFTGPAMSGSRRRDDDDDDDNRRSSPPIFPSAY